MCQAIFFTYDEPCDHSPPRPYRTFKCQQARRGGPCETEHTHVPLGAECCFCLEQAERERQVEEVRRRIQEAREAGTWGVKESKGKERASEVDVNENDKDDDSDGGDENESTTVTTSMGPDAHMTFDSASVPFPPPFPDFPENHAGPSSDPRNKPAPWALHCLAIGNGNDNFAGTVSSSSTFPPGDAYLDPMSIRAIAQFANSSSASESATHASISNDSSIDKAMSADPIFPSREAHLDQRSSQSTTRSEPVTNNFNSVPAPVLTDTKWVVESRCFIDPGFQRHNPWAADRMKLSLKTDFEEDIPAESPECSPTTILDPEPRGLSGQLIQQEYRNLRAQECKARLGFCCQRKIALLKRYGPLSNVGEFHKPDVNSENYCGSLF